MWFKWKDNCINLKSTFQVNYLKKKKQTEMIFLLLLKILLSHWIDKSQKLWAEAWWMWNKVEETSDRSRVHFIRCWLDETPQVNNQDQVTQSGNYCYSSFRVASIDEVKIQPLKDYHDSLKPHCPSYGYKRGTFSWGWSSGLSVQKISYRTQTLTKNM